MRPHALIAVNAFSDLHMKRIGEALSGWATWERIDEAASDDIYVPALSRSDIAVGWPKADHVFASNLKLLQSGSVGYDGYLGRNWSSKPTFTYCNAKGVMSIAVAEQFVAMMMGLTRRIPQHVRDMGERLWQRAETYDEVYGTTALIVGIGDIGTEIARRCLGLGMNVIGVRRNTEEQHSFIKEVYGVHDLKKVIGLADHIVLILPGGNGTDQLFDADIFAAMKPGAYFYNLARGSIVDESALYNALATNHLSGAGLDVFAVEPLPAESPLWSLHNVIIMPHSGGRSVREFDRMCDLFIANAYNFRDDKPYVNPIRL
ncbi:hypothetical protein A8709_32625 [Paenibacillus pectinilyticus]|uniref:D-isomer specific 2-hydroxyacid dehydrogenase NAD-binding domain-containing protein n=1 Tax=Paenibacillus pectinilyticus TaxID=512399 RepID=A0A1C0ZWS3_9BACL|nr:D-2-hydroxyacid dehydrogenase [Paenibacillus pectinilyticus]OCT12563.1 hypothetical protein A8709_32625 [Paenibacillus pectinilyticus]